MLSEKQKAHFLNAAVKGDLVTLSSLIYLNEVPLSEKMLKAAFDNAVLRGHLSVVEHLTTNPLTAPFMDVNLRGSYAAMIAARHGYLPLLRYLMTSPKLSAHPSLDTDNGELLFQASCKGHIDTVHFLLFDPELPEHTDLKNNLERAFWGALWNKQDNVFLKLISADPTLLDRSDEHVYLKELIIRQRADTLRALMPFYKDNTTKEIDAMLLEGHYSALNAVFDVLTDFKKDLVFKGMIGKGVQVKHYPQIKCYQEKKELLQSLPENITADMGRKTKL